MRLQLHLVLLVLLGAPACMAGPSTDRPAMRSPTLDYPLPPTQTSDGQVLGADRIPPQDKLRTSPRLGSEGLTPSQGPESVEQPTHPRCNALGMKTTARNERCPESAEPRPKR